MPHVVDRDSGYREFEKLMQDLTTLPAVYVGVRADAPPPPPKGEDAGATPDMVIIAASSEYGAWTPPGRSGGQMQMVPERSFLRSTVDEQREKYLLDIKKGLGRVIDKKSTTWQEMERLGMIAVRDVKMKITKLREPANAASTVRKKKSANPLVDTGHLRKVIDFKVVTKSEEDVLNLIDGAS